MKSWTHTLNLDDTHVLLALATPGMHRARWEQSCYEVLDKVPSRSRRTELIRMVRELFLTFDEHYHIEGDGLLLRLYSEANANAQEALVRVVWALSHEITIVALGELVRPALDGSQAPAIRVSQFKSTIQQIQNSKVSVVAVDGILDGLGSERWISLGDAEALVRNRTVSGFVPLGHVEQMIRELADTDQAGEIPLVRIDEFIRAHIDSPAKDALRKTRTILLDALSGLGLIETFGTGRNRSIRARVADVHPMVFSYLLLRELSDTERMAMPIAEATGLSQAAVLTQSSIGHAYTCIWWAIQNGILVASDDEIAIPQRAAA